MAHGITILNDSGILQVSEKSALNIYTGTSASGTLPVGPIFVKATNPSAGVYRNPLNNLIYTSDGGTFDFIRMTPTSEEIEIFSGFGLKIKNGSNLVVLESSREYPTIAYNKDVLWHKDSGVFSDTLATQKVGSSYYIDINSLGMGTYNRTLNGNTNAFMILAYFSGNLFSFNQTQIIIGPGGSGNYTRAVSNRILILNA